jgi:hypothetical protein
VISAAVRSGTVGSSPARLRTARTSRAARARCSCPESDPFEVNANTFSIVERSQRPRQRCPGSIPPLLVQSGVFQLRSDARRRSRSLTREGSHAVLPSTMRSTVISEKATCLLAANARALYLSGL